MKRKNPIERKRLFNWEQDWDNIYLDYCFGVADYPKEMETYSDFPKMVKFCEWLFPNKNDFYGYLETYYENKLPIPKTKHEFLKFKKKMRKPLWRKF